LAHESERRSWRWPGKTFHQLYHHHHGEETIFWPALRELGADESLVGDLGGEHERLAEAMTLTRNAMSALASDPSEAKVDQARAAFDTLGEVVDTHFTHEERDLEPMLAGVIASPEWKRAQAQIRKTQGPAATGVLVAWLLDNADPDARTFVRHEIPRPAVFVLSHVLGRSYKRVAAALQDSSSSTVGSIDALVPAHPGTLSRASGRG